MCLGLACACPLWRRRLSAVYLSAALRTEVFASRCIYTTMTSTASSTAGLADAPLTRLPYITVQVSEVSAEDRYMYPSGRRLSDNCSRLNHSSM